MLKPGLYEKIISEKMQAELAAVPAERKALREIDEAEASSVLSLYIADIVRRALDHVADSGGALKNQLALARRLTACLIEEMDEDEFAGLEPADEGLELLALLEANHPFIAAGHKAEQLPRPESPMARSSLFTGARNEPQMFAELRKEIRTAERVDMLVSFVKWSGLRLIIDELSDFTLRGGKLRLITTSYMGATDAKAVEELAKLPNAEIKVSYDTKRTRLHAKSYIFYRETGFHTAYIGSSNLSNAALSSGLEWNVKITAQDQPQNMQKVASTFDSYWNAPEFDFYEEGSYEKLRRALASERESGGQLKRAVFFDIKPYPFQQDILDKLQAERQLHGRSRNLLVAATGTGKTVISAFDYKNFAAARPGPLPRLLFVAHRQEILLQSLETFRMVMRDQNFGELWVGNFRPASLDRLFVSIQTLNSQRLYEQLPADFYDFIIVDEFHHAAADTYQRLLQHFTPQILLGLTATPERMDGRSILDYFDGRIAAEIRLPEAIERKLLSPFQYFGVSDTADLSRLRWERGGYAIADLNRIYTIDEAAANKRAANIVNSVERYVTDLAEVKGLGFCVSVAHARFMADFFKRSGIPSVSLDGSSPDAERASAAQRLREGEIKFIFVVDIYNEGVDIPEINTVLFLRPTESLTVFLQQLGRGLRLAEGKDCLTVLDFIGRAHTRYNFAEKFKAILAEDRHSLKYEIEKGFVSAPKGCYIHLEKMAERYILDNIRQSLNTKRGLVSRLRSFAEDAGMEPTLQNFTSYYHLDLRAIYRNYTFSRLKAEAGLIPDFSEPKEKEYRRAMARLLSADSGRWIRFMLKISASLETLDPSSLDPLELRMFRMFYVTVFNDAAADPGAPEVKENLRELAGSPVMLGEMQELLLCLHERIDFMAEPVDLGFASPLELHCTYSRDQILTALDFLKPQNVREGVKWLPEKKLDVLFVTINKSDKDYSPSTMYEDYAINEDLFHWQSQSTTAEDSPTGRRYIEHARRGSHVLLFVRENKTDAYGLTSAYTFFGKVRYAGHSGSRPMSITWKLEKPLSARLFRRSNKLIAG